MAKARPQAKRTNGGGGGTSRGPIPWWISLLAGMLIGLGLAAVVMMKGWAPSLRNEPVAPTPPAKQEPAPAEPEKPKYGFYEVLPEMEVVVPDAEVKQAKQEPPPALDPGSRYVLQAASFRNAGDAESLKAKLALLGLRAGVQTVAINGQDYFRVRVGPFADLRELDAARSQLEANGLQAIALKEAAP